MDSGKWLTKIYLIHNEVGKAEEDRSWGPYKNMCNRKIPTGTENKSQCMAERV